MSFDREARLRREGRNMEELQLPVDSAGFSRRECPRCRAHFKVRWGGREAAVLAAALARRVTHGNWSEVDGPGARRFCPYCAGAAPAEDFYTADAKRHLDREARRLDATVTWHRMRLPHEWLGANPNVTFVPVPPADAVPARPDWGDDLLRIALPCCGEEQKVTDAWLGPIRCHLCGTAHLRAGPRDIGLEMALLRQWAGEP
jgi:hypothetical protein